MNYIHPTALIGPNVVLGDNNYIGPYCIIGYPAEHKGLWPEMTPCKRHHFESAGRVEIGNNNVFTGACTVDAGTEGETVIGDNCFIMKRAHIGHDAQIGNGVIISPNCIVGGHVIIMQGANLGQAVCTHQYVVIGAYSMLGMGSVVPKKKMVEPFQTYAGNPIRHLGENKKMMHKADIKFLEEFNTLLSFQHEH